MQTTDGLSEFTIPSKSLNTSPRSIISLSRIELNLRNRKFVSEEGIGNLIKSLEIQLQRINLNVSLNKNCDDPNLRILEIVKFATLTWTIDNNSIVPSKRFDKEQLLLIEIF